MPARVRCGDAGINQLQCQAEGCCWDERATGNDIACYQKGTQYNNNNIINNSNSSNNNSLTHLTIRVLA